MPLKFDPNYLLLAIENNQLPDNENVQLVQKEIGKLKIVSGQLVACDPFWLKDGEKAFTTKLPIGEYSVNITTSHHEDDSYGSITFSTIRLANTKPIRWEMMLLPDQELSKLKDDEFWGYAVDAGMGCFADLKAIQIVHNNKDNREFIDKLADDLIRLSSRTGWCNINLEVGNIIAFSSGWGDGSYPTFAGFDEDNQLVAVVTDFMCIYHEFHGNNEDTD